MLIEYSRYVGCGETANAAPATCVANAEHGNRERTTVPGGAPFLQGWVLGREPHRASTCSMATRAKTAQVQLGSPRAQPSPECDVFRRRVRKEKSRRYCFRTTSGTNRCFQVHSKGTFQVGSPLRRASLHLGGATSACSTPILVPSLNSMSRSGRSSLHPLVSSKAIATLSRPSSESNRRCQESPRVSLEGLLSLLDPLFVGQSIAPRRFPSIR